VAKKKTPPKTDKFLAEATRLGTSKFSPAFAQIAANAASNLGAYNTGSSQRTNALNAEIGSIMASGATTQKKLGQLGTETASVYQQAMAKSQSDYSAQQQQTNQFNTGLLTSLQSERNARGLSMTSAGENNLAGNMTYGNNIAQAIQTANQGSMTRQGSMAQDTITGMKGSSSMMDNSAQSGARGLAQSELMSLYNAYLQKHQELEGQKTVTEKEKGDYILQTRMTLKDQAAQAKAEAQQRALQASIASGNLAYKNTALQVNTQYKYDKLASDVSQKDIENKLKAQGFSHKQATDIAKQTLSRDKFNLDVNKFNWSKLNPKASTSNNTQAIMDMIAAAQS
jgi:hypothetical protein